jgi:P-type Cu+ transporter
MEETYGGEDYSDGIADRAVDPVCGRAIEEQNAVAKIGYAGEMFYFCSTDCKERFQENPALFIGQRQ